MKLTHLRSDKASTGVTVGFFLALVTAPAHSVPTTMDFTFSEGGGGTLGFDYTGSNPTQISFGQVSDLTALFEVDGQTWDEDDLMGKYVNPVVGDPDAYLVDGSGGDGLDWYWDDPYNGSGDTAIFFFDNGTSVLAFDEGDFGGRGYRIDGALMGTYQATTGVAPTPITQEEIDEALQDISTTPNTSSTASVVSIACPVSNRVDPDSQFTQDCNVLVAGALVPDTDVNLEASAALSAITDDQATAPLSSSRASLSTQLRNLSTRLGALRGGATGLSIRGLTISAAGEEVFGGNLAGLPAEHLTSASGGAASADQDSWFTLEEGRLGVFVNGTISSGDKDQTTNESGFDFDGWGITAGVDYRFRDNLIAGIAGGYSKSSTDIDDKGGDLDTDGYSISLYGTYFRDEGAYVEAILTYGNNQYDQERNIRYDIGSVSVDQTASADYDGNQWSGAIGVGYDIPKGPWTFSPVARAEYLSAGVDGYSERISDPNASGGGWAARLGDLDQESFTTTLGGNVSRAFGTKWGVLLPQLHLSWIHEYIDDAISVNGSFIQDPTSGVFGIQSDSPDSDYFNARLGVSMQLAHGNSAFVYYNKIFGYRDLDVDTIGAGVRLEF